MEFVINSYKGLHALLNENSNKHTLKAKVKFSDESKERPGLMIYGKYKPFKVATGEMYNTGINEYTFVFDELDSVYCGCTTIKPILFLENNFEDFYIEYIQLQMEALI